VFVDDGKGPKGDDENESENQVRTGDVTVPPSSRGSIFKALLAARDGLIVSSLLVS
jgi:hypothetical protein